MYVATINVPGYLPMDDEPPVFETAREAWEYLAAERENSEDDSTEGEEYSKTREVLAILADESQERGGYQQVLWENFGLASDGTGTVYGSTPGRDGDHYDLGLSYSVTEVETRVCPQCGDDHSEWSE